MAYIDPLISKLKPKEGTANKELSKFPIKAKHIQSGSSSVPISKKLRDEKNIFEKHSVPAYQEKWVVSDKCSLPQKKISPIPVILTSPEGKVKELFKKNNKNRVVLGQGICPNSGFWLPKVANYVAAINDEEKQNDEKSTEKTDDRDDLKKFEEALKRNGLNLDNSNILLHVCQTIDEDWIAISKENVIRLKQKTDSVQCISIKDISVVFVETNYLAICLVRGPDKTDIEYMDVIPGQFAKTESFITNLLFASSRQTNFGIELIKVSMLELPSCKQMSQYICSVGQPNSNLYSGVAIVESVELETNINDELMMQIGSDKYQPVNIQIRGRFIKIIPTTVDSKIQYNNKDWIEINISDICSLKKSESPRPHTLTISWDSKSMNLCASNSATSDELFARLRTFKECHSIISQQPAHIILSEYFLFIFAITRSKELLLQTPKLNLISLGNPDSFSNLLASSTTEADESLCNMKNTCWWKLTFFNEPECQKFNEIFSSSVDSLVPEDC